MPMTSYSYCWKEKWQTIYAAKEGMLFPMSHRAWTVLQDVSRVERAVLYGDKDPNLKTVKWPTRFISCQRGRFRDTLKL